MGSVLIVEDDAPIRRGVLALLTMRGHAAVAAESVAQAGALLDAATPSHLLLDLNLPDGPGTEVLRRIRTQSLPVQVALMTGGSDEALMTQARELGVDAVFVKPPDWDKLLDWVAKS
ncbi:MAG TPA: response regulator [Tepidisphaeraceae bacterium]|jgi:DNA-binding response OmpR family regulator